jgi:osmotically-inducible protein OsmY
MNAKVCKKLFALLMVGALSLPAWAHSGDRAEGGRYDRQIAVEVNQKLQDDAQLRDVRAAVDDGVVTLRGSVSRYVYKEKGEKKASKVKHVADVRNLIAVRTESLSDAELFRRLARKLAYDRSNQGNVFNYLTLEVQNGVVTLGGQVRNDLARDSALEIVSNEKGVRGLVDHIQVSHVSYFDDDLRIRIARAIYGDPVLQRYAIDPGAPIRIVVDRGHVALYGVVANRMESQVAEIRAREVPGAFSVENHLLVSSDMPR